MSSSATRIFQKTSISNFKQVRGNLWKLIDSRGAGHAPAIAL